MNFEGDDDDDDFIIYCCCCKLLNNEFYSKLARCVRAFKNSTFDAPLRKNDTVLIK